MSNTLLTRDSPTSKSDVKRLLAAGPAISVGLWLWLRLVHLVVGYEPWGDPLLLDGFPVVRDVFRQIMLVLFAVGVAFAWLRVHDVSSPRKWLGIRLPGRWEWGYIPLGLVLALAGLFGSVILIDGVLGLERTTSGTSLPDVVLLSRVATLLLLVGPAEELLFRGLVQRSLRDVLGSWPAILVGATLFGVGHFSIAATAPGDLLWLGTLTVLGVIMGWVYHRTDNLVVAGLTHGVINSFTTALPFLLG